VTGTTAKPDEVRKATSDGMQRIYLIIVGFAITQGLVRALSTKEGEFFGLEPYEDAYGVQTLLLLAFLFTIIRFAHGSVLHLTALTSHKKWQWDMMGLMAQAILFFVVALSVKRTNQFICVLGAVICWDSIWLVRHVWMGISSAMEKQ
jgi:hypothetical protein